MNLWEQIAAASPRTRRENNYEHFAEEYERRTLFIQGFSFAVPNPTAIAAIKRHVGRRKLLEIGAGSGLWSKLLTDAGLQMTAVDDKSWSKDGRLKIRHSRFYAVEECSAQEAVVKYSDHRALLLCWPNYDSSMAMEALAPFTGDRFVYIGEGRGGCTGDDDFHKLLEAEWQERRIVRIPQWLGIHDGLYLYSRLPIER